MASSNRIVFLDGLRTIAALGVVWIHVWSFFGNPSLLLGPADVYKVVSILGNGVDLFFVISGFCMFLMYGRKDFEWSEFMGFVKKRWLRIAPAFYVAVLVYAIVYWMDHPSFSIFTSVFFHFLFLQNFEWVPEISAPFWSLATEWYFYLLLPFILILGRRFGFWRSVVVFGIISLIAGCFVYATDIDGWSKSIWVRLIEFIWGMGMAKIYIDNRVSDFGTIFSWWVAVSVIFFGRVLMTAQFYHRFGETGFLVKGLGAPIMTLGFALLIGALFNGKANLLHRLLVSPMFVFLGKLSYSIYLWHSLILYPLCAWMEDFLVNKSGEWAPVIAFIPVAILTSGVSYLSYKWFEEPYFKKRTPNTLQSMPIIK